jgi:hypothetical protein
MGKHLKSDVVRCPFCVEDGQFKVMTLQSGNDSYSCDNCGHLAMPLNHLFHCTCGKCLGLQVKIGPMIPSGPPAENALGAGYQSAPKRSRG